MNRRIVRSIAACGGVTIALALVTMIVQFQYAGRIYSNAHDIPSAPIAIVLGASVNDDGTASDALADRIRPLQTCITQEPSARFSSQASKRSGIFIYMHHARRSPKKLLPPNVSCKTRGGKGESVGTT